MLLDGLNILLLYYYKSQNWCVGHSNLKSKMSSKCTSTHLTLIWPRFLVWSKQKSEYGGSLKSCQAIKPNQNCYRYWYRYCIKCVLILLLVLRSIRFKNDIDTVIAFTAPYYCYWYWDCILWPKATDIGIVIAKNACLILLLILQICWRW